MNIRRTAILALTLAAGFALAAVLFQSRRLGALQNQRDQVAAAAAAIRAVTTTRTLADSPALASVAGSAAGAHTGLPAADRIRLMQLRNQVTDLRERQRGLPAISNEHARLQARLASVSNLASGRLPAGWVRRQDARMAGFGTPQAAFETFVWAIEHRDTNALAQASPALGAAFMQGDGGAERLADFWQEGAKLIPGFRIRSLAEEPGGAMRMEVEIAPGAGGPSVLARQVEGRWTVVAM